MYGSVSPWFVDMAMADTQLVKVLCERFGRDAGSFGDAVDRPADIFEAYVVVACDAVEAIIPNTEVLSDLGAMVAVFDEREKFVDAFGCPDAFTH